MSCTARIKELMNERGWTMYHLSVVSGIPQSTLSNLFIRCNSPSVSTLEKICSAFGISLAEFFTSEVGLTDDSLVLSLYHQLSPEARKAFVTLLKDLKD